MATTTILSFVGKGVAGWALNEVLEAMLKVVRSVETIDAKIDKLINSPFASGQRALELAKKYPDDSTQQAGQVEKARDRFHDAAGQVSGIKKSHALYLAGLCCDMLNDQIGKKYYYKEALKALTSYEKYMKEQHAKTSNKLGMAGLALMGGSLVAAFMAPLTIPVGIGLLLASKTGAVMTMIAKDNYSYEGLENEICSGPDLDYTGAELREALRQGLKK
jgi:hypothetical protein